MNNFEVNQKVYFIDPEEISSQLCTIKQINGEIFTLEGEDKSEIEAFEHEIKHENNLRITT